MDLAVELTSVLEIPSAVKAWDNANTSLPGADRLLFGIVVIWYATEDIFAYDVSVLYTEGINRVLLVRGGRYLEAWRKAAGGGCIWFFDVFK